MIGRLCDYTACHKQAVCTGELVGLGLSAASTRPRDYCLEHARDRLGEIVTISAVEQFIFKRIEGGTIR